MSNGIRGAAPADKITADCRGAVRMKLFHIVGEKHGCMITVVFEPKKRFRST